MSAGQIEPQLPVKTIYTVRKAMAAMKRSGASYHTVATEFSVTPPMARLIILGHNPSKPIREKLGIFPAPRKHLWQRVAASHRRALVDALGILNGEKR